ncbi:Oxidation resistance protein 1 [Spathaspora sp. JA1]|nr:Oxidation resistance protein 1 [Spathaspora sp. JA1]
MAFLLRKFSRDEDSDRPSQEEQANLITLQDNDESKVSTKEQDDDFEPPDIQDTTNKPENKLESFFKGLVRSPTRERERERETSSPRSIASSHSSHASSSTLNNILPPLTLAGYSSTTRHKLLDLELANNIRNLTPARFQLFDTWDLVYSMEQHGISLNTLYRHCNLEFQQRQFKKKRKAERGFADSIVSNMVVSGDIPTTRYTFEGKRPLAYVLIIKDENGSKFGAYLNQNLKPMDQKRYYGNGECFLWKNERYIPNEYTTSTTPSTTRSNKKLKEETRFKAFMYTGINDNIIYSNNDFIAIGSSNGQNGIYIDKSLYKGVSYKCDTFGNEILNSKVYDDGAIGRFKIMGLEIWRIGTLD